MIRINDSDFVASDKAYKAILNNDIESLKSALRENRQGSITYVDVTRKNITALSLASSLGKEEFVAILIEAGSLLDATDSSGSTAIHYAAENGHKAVLNCLIFNGIDVKTVNSNGSTAIHLAACNGHYDIVKFLVDTQKIDIDKVDKNEMTALLYAAKEGHLKVLRYLILKDAKTDVKANKKTLLVFAAEQKHYECFTFIIKNVQGSLTTFLQTFKKPAADFIIKFSKERKADFEEYASSFINSIIETERLDLAIMLLVNNIQLQQPGVRNTDGIFIELCSKKYLEVDDLVAKYPKCLFYSSVLLSYCKSPVKILNKLYDEVNSNDSVISSIIRQLFVSQDKMVIMNMLCYQKSLLNAASSHPLEQEDLNLWISQIDNLILELFKSKSLDNTDYMLQLLLPSLNLSEYDQLEASIQKEIKELSALVPDKDKRTDLENRVDEDRKRQDDFLALHKSWSLAHFEKISGIIESVFYSGLIPTKSSIENVRNHSICSYALKTVLNNNRRKSLFLFIGKILKNPNIVYPTMLDNLTAKEEMEITNTITLIENLRYCPAAMFAAEVLSKLATIGLVAYISLQCYTEGPVNSDLNSAYDDILVVGQCKTTIPETYIIIMLFANATYELGQLAESNWKLNRYINTWNILDMISIALLALWAYGYFYKIHYYQRIFLPLSAVPLSLGLLQSVSVIKSVGQLIIMIRAMVWDLFAMFILFVVCTFGFAVTLSGLVPDVQSYESFPNSFMSLFAATLGSFELFAYEKNSNNSITQNGSFAEVESKVIATTGNALLILYLLGATVMLLNLLIARMSNTHNRIDGKSLQEWSYFMGQTLQSYVLVREKSCLCLLPAPFNLATTILLPLQYILRNKGGVEKTTSLAGTLADFVLLICGSILSIPLVAAFLITRFLRLIRTVSKSSFRGSYVLISILFFLFPFYLIFVVLLHIFSLFTALPNTMRKRSMVFTLPNGVIAGFENNLDGRANDRIDYGDENQIYINPIAEDHGVEMNVHTRIDEDDTVSSNVVQTVTVNRVFFSSYDIEHIMKHVRVISQAESIDKKLAKLDDHINSKYNDMSSKYDAINAKLNLLIEGLEELKPKRR